ncbi:MAG: GEVED domain-containing protein [Bacteroidia bacterium]
MKKSYLLNVLTTIVMTFLTTAFGAFGQTNIASYSLTRATGGTYTALTAPTVFQSGGYDDAVSAAIPLGGTFTYGGVAYTTCFISTNGFITFGAAPSSTSYTPLSTLGTTTGAIAAFGQDAGGSTAAGATPEISYLNIGGATGEFVVQYKDHANFYNSSTERLNFQIHLNLSTNQITIIYGTCTAPGTSTSGSAPFLGIRGNSTAWATNVNNLMIGNVPAGTTCDWSNAVTGNANSSTMLFSSGTNANVSIPAGLTFTWTPQTAVAPVRTHGAVTSITSSGATITWTAPTGATQYNVQYRALGTCGWTTFAGSPVAATTAVLTGLASTTTYQVQVQASNGTNNAIYSHIPNAAGTGNGYVAAGTFTTLSPPCSGTPAAGTAASSLNPVCSGTSFTLSLTGATTGVTGLTYQWQSSPDGITYTNIPAATAATYATTQTSATYYQCIVTCTASGLSATSTPLNETMNSFSNCYCTSNPTSTVDEDIFNVTLGSLNNSSTCATTGGTGSILNEYSNYTAIPAPNLQQGVPYSLSVQIGTCGGTFNNSTRVYIDYNQDGDFLDAGETIYTSAAATSGAHTESATITIPVGATLGNTRMRVITSETSTPTSITPCGTYSWGETEDYLVNITVATVCTGAPSAGTTAGPTGACTATAFTVSLTGATTGVGGLTYQWQSSPDGVTYTNIGGATSATASVTQTAATYYQCIVTCTTSGLSATSTPLNVPMNSMFNCYCVPTYSSGCSLGDEITNVTLLTLNNSSTCAGTPYYTFFSSATVPDLAQGSANTISVSFGTDGSQYAGVWIDFNQDGDFADAGEFCANSTVSAGSGGTTTLTINVPAGATLGNTMMRVRGGNDSQLANTPCGASSSAYGETEDYKVNIVLPPPCPAPSGLAAGSITSTTASLSWVCTACTGTFKLEYGPTGFTPGAGTIINPATSPVAVSGLTSGTTYQFYVTQDCSGTGAGFSTPTGPVSFTTHAAGDDVCSAIALAFGTNGPYSNAGKTVEAGEPAPPGGICNSQTTWCNTGLENTMWFTFVAPASGRVSITSPGFDTQLALWSAPNCGAILTGGAVLIAANDDGGPSFSSVINPVNCLTPGTTYYVQLDGYSGTVGTTNIVLTDLGVVDPSFTGLTSPVCSNATALTLTPATSGGVFAGTGVTGSTFDPAASGAGTYSVTYTVNGCYTSTQSVTVNAAPTASSVITTPVACNGGTATISVTATGGSGTYSGTGTFSGVAPGPYTYTVTDAGNACTSTTAGTVTQPSAITVTPSSTAIMCNGGSSSVTISATGGTGALTGTGTFPQSAGTTVYTVTDANSCTATSSVTVTEPTALAVSYTESGVMCNGGTSTITISATGGTPAYTGTGAQAPVTAGTYSYTVTDANGCMSTQSVTVTEPTVLATSASSTGIACFGGSATVTLNGTGGTAPYSGTGPFTQTAADGTVTYTLTDANGCTATVTNTETDPAELFISTGATSVMCNGGTATVTVSSFGGTGTVSGTGTFPQAAGTQSYTITDANGCTASSSVTVTEPAAITVTTTSGSIMCNGGTDNVTVSATGGTGTLTGTGTFPQAAGTTVYTVTDANSCTGTASVTLTEPSAVMVMTSFTPIACNGGSSTVMISGMGGTPGAGPAYLGEGSFTQAAGTTTYTITDMNGCTASSNVTITEPAAIASSQNADLCAGQSVTVGTSTYSTAGTYTDVLTAFNGCDSTVTTVVTNVTVDATTTTAGATITANSSTGTFQWLDCNTGMSPIAGETNQSFTATADGSYAVQVTDNGCVDTSACVMIVGTGLNAGSAANMIVYPNPSSGVFNLSFTNANFSELLITVVDVQGKLVYSSSDKNISGAYNKVINLEELGKGLYYIKVNTGTDLKIQKLTIQ